MRDWLCLFLSSSVFILVTKLFVVLCTCVNIHGFGVRLLNVNVKCVCVAMGFGIASVFHTLSVLIQSTMIHLA